MIVIQDILELHNVVDFMADLKRCIVGCIINGCLFGLCLTESVACCDGG